VFNSCSSFKINEWIIDTGATDHITRESKGMQNMHNTHNTSHINMPNRSKAIITQKGCITLKNRLSLRDAFVFLHLTLSCLCPN